MGIKKVGTITLGDTVDITDPCYDANVWCRMTTKCVPGEYTGYVIISDEGEWGKRVASISIYRNDVEIELKSMDKIGSIGVDAGMAGFFNDKPDFNDDEWDKLCDKVNKGDAWCLYDGIFSNSGYGDGSYEVYASVDRDAFTIVFID